MSGNVAQSLGTRPSKPLKLSSMKKAPHFGTMSPVLSKELKDAMNCSSWDLNKALAGLRFEEDSAGENKMRRRSRAVMTMRRSFGNIPGSHCVMADWCTRLSTQSMEVTEWLSEAEGTSKMYEDSLFPPSLSSVWKNPDKPPPKAPKIEGFKRCVDICPDGVSLFVDHMNTGDVVQGALGNCWFLGPLSVIAWREDLRKGLCTFASVDHGIYIIKFYCGVFGWVEVTVDDYLPVDATGLPVFGRCRNVNEVWVSIIEKAYAKLYGCYESLEGGSEIHAFHDLVGGAGSIVRYKEENSSMDAHDLWRHMTSSIKSGNLLGACHNVNREPSGHIKKPGFIQDNHAYGVLDACVLQGEHLMIMRNPWGFASLNAIESGISDESKRAPLAQKYGYIVNDPAVFWMTRDKFFEMFNYIYDCEVPPLSHTTSSIPCKWDGTTAGGSSRYNTWPSNPQFLITADSDTDVIASLYQDDERFIRPSERTQAPFCKPMGMYALKADENGRKILSIRRESIISSQVFEAVREKHMKFHLRKGECVNLIPTTYHPNTCRPFVLTTRCSGKVVLKHIDGPSDWKIYTFSGVWSPGVTAGGCANHDTWKENPVYEIELKRPTRAVIRLCNEEKPEMPHIGFYLLKGRSRDMRALFARTAKFENVNAWTMELDLSIDGDTEDNALFTLIPCTFKPDILANYRLEIYSAESEGIVRVTPVVQAVYEDTE